MTDQKQAPERPRAQDKRGNEKILLRNGHVTTRVVHPAFDYNTGKHFHYIWHGRRIPVRRLDQPKPHGRTNWLITWQEYRL